MPRPVVLKDVELFVGEVVLDGPATRIPVAIDVNPLVFLFLEIAARGVARVLAVSALCLQAFCGIHDTCWQRGSVWRTMSNKMCKTSFILCAPILSKKDSVHLLLNPSNATRRHEYSRGLSRLLPVPGVLCDFLLLFGGKMALLAFERAPSAS